MQLNQGKSKRTIAKGPSLSVRSYRYPSPSPSGFWIRCPFCGSRLLAQLELKLDPRGDDDGNVESPGTRANSEVGDEVTDWAELVPYFLKRRGLSPERDSAVAVPHQ